MAPSNYSTKIQKIKDVRDALLTMIATLPIIKKVSGVFADFQNNETDLPLVIVIYRNADSPNVRENSNWTAHFDIAVKDKGENELDQLDTAKAIVDLLEDYTLGGIAIGIVPHAPEIYSNTSGAVGTVQTVIRLDVEI